jgi:hypothetical protein
MPTARITVTAISDEGDTVIIWGRPDNASDGSEPVGYAFQAKGGHDTAALAEQASRLAAGTEAVVEYTVVVEGWSIARALSVL